ncbi:MAG: Asp-tRNA(Asn)/Glu-tRNA(Gln) amidotransferase subunit GatB [Epulopiscium sp.]|nr:Asp-tRNA(Asn)/Glu-tRNA(Gln) amidotransferase subunit GatB [Candidatus Epulonipiscium sp.]
MVNQYEVVIGLEVHAELKTKSKIYCSCSTQFGGEPNTQCCPTCMGFPGTFPVLNEKVVEYALRAGLAMNCSIARQTKQDRKNYFYPDLPKGYQISQYDIPLCYEGYVEIPVDEGNKKIGIQQIHIEEDAGKLIHTEEGTFIDYNRSGVPLIEIVSKPDLSSPEEAKRYLETLRNILLYIGVSDCKMNEGSLRCDINLSVRKKGDPLYGERTEIKNMNSFSYALKAMEYEASRQIQALEKGEKIQRETRRWDEKNQCTFPMRKKEEAQDYRYFPEPDIPLICISKEQIQRIQKSLPELPHEKRQRWITDYHITPEEADVLIGYQKTGLFFEETIRHYSNAVIIANWILGEGFRFLTEEQKEQGEFPFTPIQFAELLQLVEEEIISNHIGKQVFEIMYKTGKSPSMIVEENQWKQISDTNQLQEIIDEVLQKNQKSVNDYITGKKVALKALMGQVMKVTKGKANPQKANKILKERLENKKRMDKNAKPMI